MIHDRERVLRIRDAGAGGLKKACYLHGTLDNAELRQQLELVRHLFEHVGDFCSRLLGQQQSGSREYESRRLDNAERMVDVAAGVMEVLERMARTSTSADQT